MDSVDALREAIVTVMWSTSAEHAAINFSQWDFIGFVPNRPLGMYAPYPKAKGDDLDIKTLMRALPDENMSVQQQAIVNLLSEKNDKDEMIHLKPQAWKIYMDYDTQGGPVDAFLDAMQKFDEECKGRDTKYTYLRPKNVPFSIAI